jgi:light-regulated signal transduction histidine kinase (bacteriophytochrome)
VIALLVTAACALIRFALDPVVHTQVPLLVFACGVVVAALFGGMIAGIAATILAIPVADYLFLEPRYTWFIRDTPAESVSLVVFVVLGIAISLIIEAFHRTRERLRRAGLDLEKSSQEFQTFAYRVAHDLKEPLRMIATFSEMLVRRNQAAADAESLLFTGYIQGGVGRIESQLRDLIDYAKAGSREVQRELIDFNAVVDSAIANLSSTIAETSATVTHDHLPKLVANPDRIRSVFQNLIGNALKYRGASPPIIHVSARVDDDHWTFSVQDNGIGFDMKQADQIFKEFARGPSAAKTQGSGLGLAIVKRIVELKGGRIWAQSEPGKGSTFHFTIPRSGATGGALSEVAAARRAHV